MSNGLPTTVVMPIARIIVNYMRDWNQFHSDDRIGPETASVCAYRILEIDPTEVDDGLIMSQVYLMLEGF